MRVDKNGKAKDKPVPAAPALAFPLIPHGNPRDSLRDRNLWWWNCVMVAVQVHMQSQSQSRSQTDRHSRRRADRDFEIHRDAEPSTGDTDVNTDAVDKAHDKRRRSRKRREQLEEEQETSVEDEEEDEEDEEDDDDDDDDDQPEGPDQVLDQDMRKLQRSFPGFKNKYRLIKKIGEGTFSTVYKAEDIQYEHYENKWDLDKESEKWAPPPLRRQSDAASSPTAADAASSSTIAQVAQSRRPPKFVAIKKIYVTSSPARILNELELLHDLRNCPAVCPLITAFRSTDQVVAILPYFRHQDFRDYFREMLVSDMAIYLRSLFTALSFVHSHHIIHRDIKPTNFLYDPESRRGVLVDFGLAEREGTDTKPCVCHEDSSTRRQRLRSAYVANGGPHQGYPKNDTRPSRRANRAGTRGFRAPEVLFKCTEQTTKIDIWSAGVILLTIMSRRFPFFNSADDVDAMIEISTIFGHKRMRQTSQLHGAMYETNIPTIGQNGFDLGKIIMWSTLRNEEKHPLEQDERIAIDFLERCLDLDPRRRISAEDALEHDFLLMAMEGASAGSEEDDMDIL